jgi:alkylation response protein AidB-like acyl-CoA dehydrogenase
MTATDTTTDVDPDVRRLEELVDALVAEHDPASTSAQEFRGAQYDAGLAWVHFPQGWGGQGLRPELQRVVERRLREAGAPAIDEALFFAIALAGPTVVTHGSDELKRRLLRPMFTGEHRWCQLFSEPGSGSDLAGLATRAVRDGEEWVVNGQKVWNTLAHRAEWGMLVARTDPDVPKHKGLTYFAVDMHAPGVEVRPLVQITGEAEFNEVYLTDVRVPDADRIGEVGEGWRVALTTLANERVAIGGGGTRPQRGSGSIAEAVRIWKDRKLADPAVKDELMRYWVEAETLRLTNMRAAANRTAGNPGPEGSIAKLALANLNKSITELCINLLGPEGLVGYEYTFERPTGVALTYPPGSARKMFLRSRANSIEGGTTEIMKNILGEQVLGLPGEPRVDKDRPWAEVPRS